MNKAVFIQHAKCLQQMLMTVVLPAMVLISMAFFSLSTPLYADSHAKAESEVKKGTYVGAKNATHPDWFKESFLEFSEDIDEATAAGKRLALYFWQPGCPYCNQLWEHNMAVSDIERTFKDNFDVVALNMWGDQELITVGGKAYTEKQLAEALDVNFTPTLVFYSEAKKPALRINGYYPPKKFRQALQYVKDKKERELTFSEYARSDVSAAKKGDKLISEPYFLQPPYQLDRSKVPGQRPLVILFETPDCEPCEVLHSKILQHQSTKDLLSSMDVVQLDPRSTDNIMMPNGEAIQIAKWVKQLNISYFPSAVFFDEAGQQVMKMDAAFRHFHTESIFAYVLEKAYLTEPSFQRYISARAEILQEQGIDVDIWAY